MADNFMTFPETEIEALAMLYMQAQDLTGKAPSEIYDMYVKAYYAILKEKRETKDWRLKLKADALGQS